MTRLHPFTQFLINELRASDEPTALAKAIADALMQHLADVAEDDPGDNETLTSTTLTDAEESLGAFIDNLNTLLKGE